MEQALKTMDQTLLTAIFTTGGIALSGLFTIWSTARAAKAAASERKEDRDANRVMEDKRIQTEERRREKDAENDARRWKQEREIEERRLQSAEQIAREKHVRDLATQMALEAWRRKVAAWEALPKDEKGRRMGPGLSGPLNEPELQDVLSHYFDNVCRTLKAPISSNP